MFKVNAREKKKLIKQFNITLSPFHPCLIIYTLKKRIKITQLKLILTHSPTENAPSHLEMILLN